MPERLFQKGKKTGPSIRYHHLEIWSDFVGDYIKHFEGKKPWEMTSDEFDDVPPFIDAYLAKGMKSEIATKDFFEHARLDNPGMRGDYRYLIDLLGFDEGGYEQVLSRRITYFSHILELAHLSGDLPIELTETPDEYCGSCAIGRHCKVSIWRFFVLKSDTVYKRTVGRKSITTGDLFDPEFYLKTRLEAERRFPSWFGRR